MTMPRSLQEILDHADELAARFEADDAPGTVQDVDALRRVRDAATARAAAERELTESVTAARAAGCSWAAIAVFLGTSGEAARQRYGSTAKDGAAPRAKARPKARQQRSAATMPKQDSHADKVLTATLDGEALMLVWHDGHVEVHRRQDGDADWSIERVSEEAAERLLEAMPDGLGQLTRRPVGDRRD
jgi:hypothetical protein